MTRQRHYRLSLAQSVFFLAVSVGVLVALIIATEPPDRVGMQMLKSLICLACGGQVALIVLSYRDGKGRNE